MAAERTPPPPVVSVVASRRMTVPMMAEPIGTTRALEEISIRARVRGFLKEMHFKEGSDVKKDQLLFVIDEEPFKAELASARARLAQAEAALKMANDSKAREVATAQVTLGQSMLALAEVEERREQSLLKRNATSVEDVQRKQAIRQRDAAQLDAYKASLEQAKADHDTAIAAATADVAEAKARVTSAEINLSYCRMFSTIDGRIGLAQVKVGNYVGAPGGSLDANFTELAVVRQLDPIGVDIQVASRYLDRATRLVSSGLPAEIFRPGVEGDTERRYPGTVDVIDNTIDPTTSTFRVRATVPNPDKTLLPGEYVKIVMKVGEFPDSIVVPEQSVIETQAGPVVYTVDSQGKVNMVPVKTVITYEGLRVLESGLDGGEQVIVEGIQLVRPGITVKAEPFKPDEGPSTTATPRAEPAAGADEPETKPAAKAAEPAP